MVMDEDPTELKVGFPGALGLDNVVEVPAVEVIPLPVVFCPLTRNQYWVPGLRPVKV